MKDCTHIGFDNICLITRKECEGRCQEYEQEQQLKFEDYGAEQRSTHIQELRELASRVAITAVVSGAEGIGCTIPKENKNKQKNWKRRNNYEQGRNT